MDSDRPKSKNSQVSRTYGRISENFRLINGYPLKDLSPAEWKEHWKINPWDFKR